MANPPYPGQLASGGFKSRIGTVVLDKRQRASTLFPVGTVVQLRRTDRTLDGGFDYYGISEADKEFFVLEYSTIGDMLTKMVNERVAFRFTPAPGDASGNTGTLSIETYDNTPNEYDLFYFSKPSAIFHADSLFVPGAVNRSQPDFTTNYHKQEGWQPGPNDDLSLVQPIETGYSGFQVCCVNENPRIFVASYYQFGAGVSVTGISGVTNNRYTVYNVPEKSQVHIVVPSCPYRFEELGAREQMSFDVQGFQNGDGYTRKVFVTTVMCAALEQPETPPPTMPDYAFEVCCRPDGTLSDDDLVTLPLSELLATASGDGVTFDGITSEPDRGELFNDDDNLYYIPPTCEVEGTGGSGFINEVSAQDIGGAVSGGNSGDAHFEFSSLARYDVAVGDVLVMFVQTDVWKNGYTGPVLEAGWTLVNQIKSTVGMVPALYYRTVDQAYLDRHNNHPGNQFYPYWSKSATWSDNVFSDQSRFEWGLTLYRCGEVGADGAFIDTIALEYRESASASQTVSYTPAPVSPTADPSWTSVNVTAVGTNSTKPQTDGFGLLQGHFETQSTVPGRESDVYRETGSEYQVSATSANFYETRNYPYTDSFSIQSARYYYVKRLTFRTKAVFQRGTGGASNTGDYEFTIGLKDSLGQTGTGRVTVTVKRCSTTIPATGRSTIGPFRSVGRSSAAFPPIDGFARNTIRPIESRGSAIAPLVYTPDPPIYFPPEEQTPYVPPEPPVPLCRTFHGYGVFVATDDGVDPADWSLHRQQPCRMDSPKLKSALVYDLDTEIDEKIADANRPIIRRSPQTPRAEGLSKKKPLTIADEPLKLDGMHVYDPFWGLIPGVAEREITYQTEYDPASYQENAAWGPEHVGELWWNTASVAYLDAQTDVLDSGDAARTAAEIEHRKATWGKLAPGSVVRVYEWVRSTEIFDDVDQGPFGPAGFVARTEFDTKLSREVIAYYSWRLNNPEPPPATAKNRTLSALAVSQIIANPTGKGVTWIAPIMPNGMLLANLHPHVNNTDSVLQIDVAKNDSEGEVHHDWQIVRALDPRTAPPAHLLRGMNHALVGFDDLHRAVPDPSLHPRDRFGATVRPRRSLLASTRSDILMARRSYVDGINAIFARTSFLYENPGALALLTRSTPTYENLVWSQPTNTVGIEFPPANAYDFEAASFEERDALLVSYEFYIQNGYRPWEKHHFDMMPWDFDSRVQSNAKSRPARILVTNYDADTPSWSIWEVPTDTYHDPEHPGDALVLSHQFDLTYPSYADMLSDASLGLIPEGKRCLVTADERYDGFWTLHAFRPSNTAADANGFIYENAQTYRTSDFLTVIDWYADGYTPLKAPQVSYPTIEARNLAEVPSPANTFVLIEDDSTGAWIWTVWDGSAWITVARQNGTLKVTDAFCDPSRVVYGIGNKTPVLADIERRDGTLELRQIELALRQGIFDRGQINETFFSLLHFAHTRQDQVDWAFKTSFLTVVGFNERLEQTPIATYDQTQNLLDYIDEVKPYRVKTRDFTRALTPPRDGANVHATDFDKPVVFDARSGTYRRLDPNNADDMAYMARHMPWTDWYETFTNPSRDVTSPNYNPVRRMRTRLRFDRTDSVKPYGSGSGWDLVPFDLLAWDGDEKTRRHGGSAFARLLTWYEPGPHMVAKDEKDVLLGSGFKGTIIDGGSLKDDGLGRDSDIDGNPQGETLDLHLNPNGKHYAFRDPHHEAERPPELVQTITNSSLAITARSRWVPGGPNQWTAHVSTKRVRAGSVTLHYAHVASSASAVLVYRDGVRLIEGTDYTVDHFERAITVALPGTARPRYVMAHVFGPAATGTIAEQRFYRADGASGRFALTRTASGTFDVVVNGARIAPSAISNEANAIVLAPAPVANADVLINVLGDAPGASKATHVRQQVLAFNTGRTWLLDAPSAAVSPQHAGTIVEVNGRRLTPPFTRYGHLTKFQPLNGWEVDALDVVPLDRDEQMITSEGNRYILLREVSDIANLTVIVDGRVYTKPIKHLPDGANLDGTNIAPGFELVLAGPYLVANDPEFEAKRVIAIVREDHEYDVVNGTLTILKTLKASDRIVATTFENADLMGIETHSFDGSIGGVYRMHTEASEEAYVSVWRNGLRLTSGVEYAISHYPLGYGEASFEEPAYGFGDDAAYTRVTIPGDQDPADRIVIMAYAGAPARYPSTWGLLTATASPALMGQPVLVNDLDNAPLQSEPLASSVRKQALSSQGMRPLFRMNGTWEVFPWDDWSGAILESDLLPEDETVSVRLGTLRLHPDLATVNPLDEPDLEAGRPGVVWIDGERIEYFALDRDGDLVTLSELRRGTRLTGFGSQKQVSKLFPGALAAGALLRVDGLDYAGRIEVARRAANGQMTAFQLGRDYTVVKDASGSAIRLTRSLAAGQTISVLQEGKVKHEAGKPVRNATRSTGAVTGCPFGIRDEAPVVDTDATQATVRF